MRHDGMIYIQLQLKQRKWPFESAEGTSAAKRVFCASHLDAVGAQRQLAHPLSGGGIDGIAERGQS